MLDWLRDLLFGNEINNYKESIRILNDMIKQLQTDNAEHENELVILRNDKAILEQQLHDALDEDTSTKPEWFVEGTSYRPKIYAEGEYITLQDPRQIYAYNDLLKEFAKTFKDMEHDDKLKTIWTYVIRQLYYKYDVYENWQYAPTSIERRMGDCDDGSILFLAICRVSGIKANEVFNACGWFDDGTNKFGHSFPIAKMSDGKWYVFETTLNNIPEAPKLMKGSPYKANWGLANWKFAGNILNGERNGWQI